MGRGTEKIELQEESEVDEVLADETTEREVILDSAGPISTNNISNVEHKETNLRGSCGNSQNIDTGELEKENGEMSGIQEVDKSTESEMDEKVLDDKRESKIMYDQTESAIKNNLTASNEDQSKQQRKMRFAENSNQPIKQWESLKSGSGKAQPIKERIKENNDASFMSQLNRHDTDNRTNETCGHQTVETNTEGLIAALLQKLFGINVNYKIGHTNKQEHDEQMEYLVVGQYCHNINNRQYHEYGDILEMYYDMLLVLSRHKVSVALSKSVSLLGDTLYRKYDVTHFPSMDENSLEDNESYGLKRNMRDNDGMRLIMKAATRAKIMSVNLAHYCNQIADRLGLNRVGDSNDMSLEALLTIFSGVVYEHQMKMEKLLYEHEAELRIKSSNQTKRKLVNTFNEYSVLSHQNNAMIRNLSDLYYQIVGGLAVFLSYELSMLSSMFLTQGSTYILTVLKTEYTFRYRISPRLNVVLFEYFESAMRESIRIRVQLTSTNIYTHDNRIPTAVPIYMDGFIFRKDNIR